MVVKQDVEQTPVIQYSDQEDEFGTSISSYKQATTIASLFHRPKEHNTIQNT